MRTTTPALMLAALLATAGCQETGTGGATHATSTGTASTGAATPAPEAPRSPENTGVSDLMITDKTMEIAVPGGGMATLKYMDIKVGDGSIAAAGKVALVHYTGWLTDGTKFDSSLDRNQPYRFRIGDEPPAVIAGWDRGVRGMRVGGKRKLVIPAELGYGARGAGGVIPPNATLVFDVELLGIQ